MPLPQGLHGIREETPDNLVLDAGILYKNIDIAALRDVGTGQITNALAAAARMGATRGGSTFNSNKENRQVEADGKRLPIKGFNRIDGYAPVLATNLLELDKDNLKDAMGVAVVDTWTVYYEITPMLVEEDEDYIDNIALLATKVGDTLPLVLVMENVLAVNPVEIPFADKAESVLAVEFAAHALASAPGDVPYHVFVPIPAGS